MTGLGVGVAGLGVTVLAIVADTGGVETAMQCIAFWTLLPWTLVWFLPAERKQTAESAPGTPDSGSQERLAQLSKAAQNQ